MKTAALVALGLLLAASAVRADSGCDVSGVQDLDIPKTRQNVFAGYMEERATAKNLPDCDQMKKALAQINDNYKKLNAFLDKLPADKQAEFDKAWAANKGDAAAREKFFSNINQKPAAGQLQAASVDPITGRVTWDNAEHGAENAVYAGGGKTGATGTDSRYADKKGFKTNAVPDAVVSKAGPGTDADEKKKAPFKFNDQEKASMKMGLWAGFIGAVLGGPAGLVLFGCLGACAGYVMAKQGEKSDDSGGDSKSEPGGAHFGEGHEKPASEKPSSDRFGGKNISGPSFH